MAFSDPGRVLECFWQNLKKICIKLGTPILRRDALFFLRARRTGSSAGPPCRPGPSHIPVQNKSERNAPKSMPGYMYERCSPHGQLPLATAVEAKVCPRFTWGFGRTCNMSLAAALYMIYSQSRQCWSSHLGDHI